MRWTGVQASRPDVRYDTIFFYNCGTAEPVVIQCMLKYSTVVTTMRPCIAAIQSHPQANPMACSTTTMDFEMTSNASSEEEEAPGVSAKESPSSRSRDDGRVTGSNSHNGIIYTVFLPPGSLRIQIKACRDNGECVVHATSSGPDGVFRERDRLLDMDGDPFEPNRVTEWAAAIRNAAHRTRTIRLLRPGGDPFVSGTNISDSCINRARDAAGNSIGPSSVSTTECRDGAENSTNRHFPNSRPLKHRRWRVVNSKLRQVRRGLKREILLNVAEDDCDREISSSPNDKTDRKRPRPTTGDNNNNGFQHRADHKSKKQRRCFMTISTTSSSGAFTELLDEPLPDDLF